MRSEAIEGSMKEHQQSLLPTPIVNRNLSPKQSENPRHRRISIFNRATNQMQQSVIKLNPTKPVPTRVRRLDFTTELSPEKKSPTHQECVIFLVLFHFTPVQRNIFIGNSFLF